MATSLLPIRLGFEPEKSLQFGSITSSYTQVGSSFSHPIRILVLQNQTSNTVTFSLDGVNDTVTLLTNTSLVLNVCSNRTLDQGLFVPIGGSVWVKSSSSVTSGMISVSAFYGSGPI